MLKPSAYLFVAGLGLNCAVIFANNGKMPALITLEEAGGIEKVLKSPGYVLLGEETRLKPLADIFSPIKFSMGDALMCGGGVVFLAALFCRIFKLDVDRYVSFD